MDETDILDKCHKILQNAKCDIEYVDAHNFLDFTNRVRDVMLDWSQARKTHPTAIQLAESIRRIRDDFDVRASADPMILYRPRHGVALAFHKSQAKGRYFHSGNRCSKTVPGIYEMYCALIGTHPFRPNAHLPSRVFTVGMDYTKYGETVWVAKYLEGEAGNPLSPVFPEGGKWFNHYDAKNHCITISCSRCAKAGKALQCKHAKSKHYLFSDQNGPGVLAGGQYVAFHLDEQIDEDIFNEARERIKTVPNSFYIVTETPLKGKSFWTWRRLAKTAERGDVIPGTDISVVEKFNIDQFQAGLVDHSEIIASMTDMSDAEIQARIFGMPAVDSNKAVFDLDEVSNMYTDTKEPKIGVIDVDYIDDFEQQKWCLIDGLYPKKECLRRANYLSEAQFTVKKGGLLQVWADKELNTQYLISADVSEGLTKRDASSADVWKLTNHNYKIHLEQVAQYHGWINPDQYAEELYALGLLYSQEDWHPQLVVERNGPGFTVIRQLIDLGCPFVFLDDASAAAVKIDVATQYGVGTSALTKPAIIASLQSYVKARKLGQPTLIIRSKKTLIEMENYIQEPTATGYSMRFQAATTKDNAALDDDTTGRDDRVMSAGLGTYAVQNHTVYDFSIEELWKRTQITSDLDSYSKKFWQGVHGDRDKVQEEQDELDYYDQEDEDYEY